MKQCVCTTTFTVLVNGRPQGGWIHLQWGIRQGCPLAPLLFILAADTLAICTEQLCIRGYLTGFQITGRPGDIPLLQYTDDTTFFIRGSTVAAYHVYTMLDIFSDFSGMQLNRSKSSIVGIGLDSKELARVAAVLSTPIALFPIRYLGLPLTEGRLRNLDWQPVIKKIEAAFEDGRLGFSPAVVVWFSCNPYWRSFPFIFIAIFRIPEGVRRQIESIMRRFFWQGTHPSETRGVALVAWRTVCRPKTLGGLAIRHLRHTNTALLANWETISCSNQRS